MACTICTKTNPIPQCTTTLELGAVSETDVIVVVTEVATGRFKILDGTVTIGILTIDLSTLGAFISPNLEYNIQAHDTNLGNYNTPIDITIDGVAYTCLVLNVDSIVNAAGVITGAISIALEIDA